MTKIQVIHIYTVHILTSHTKHINQTLLPYKKMFPSPSLCFFIIIITFTLSLPSTLCLNQQGLYLHQAKLLLDDPSSSLSSWNPRDDHPCHWLGITCSTSSNSVVSIDLDSLNLSGPFPTLLCRLPDLAFLSLANNNINQTLPREISLCSRLQHLDLSQNLLTGALPGSLAELEELRFLDFTGNNFSGAIPESFGGFRRLEVLSLVYNLLDGTVPGFLGNVSSLRMLNLSYNPFAPGRVPAELGNLTGLEVLWLTDCNLVGSIPESLGRLWRLKDLDLAVNGLFGSVPDSISGMSNVVQIELYNNSLTGELPVRWSNMTKLRLLDASMNMIAGAIPRELCELPLESLNLYENRLSGSLPEAIAGSPNLYELRLFGNGLSGPLPEKLGLVSPLRWVDLSSNRFSGELPRPICEMGRLEELLVIKNRFSGSIPAGLGGCVSLTRLRLGRNRFSGEVPAGLWGLPGLNLLELSDNSLSGSIGAAIASAKNLSQFVISKNNFSGSIPYGIGFLDNLEDFTAGENAFSGSLPRSIVNLQNLGKLDLHGNDLSGELPSGLGSLTRLNELVLRDNRFTGKIPDGIGRLSSLNYLDLSGNRFSGEIPLGIQDLKLDRLNLSYNRLSGDLPPLLGGRVYRNSFLGNPRLCGDLVSSCGESEYLKNKGYIWLLRSIFVLSGFVFIVGAIWFYLKYRDLRMGKTVIDKSKWTLMSFHKLGFSEYEVLDSLDEDNVIGSGASGKVYKVVLSSGEAVAVKRLWGSKKDEPVAEDGFGAEVETLGRIRHKNIVKLWCSCSTRDCKLLVYEFMPNGSLGDLLHSTKAGSLGWPKRLGIALDAAEGLAYLHHDCVPPIVHRDVKSNNILLDGDYGARVADFGVAKVVDGTAGKGAESMSVIAGSCGYIAPEYAYTLRVNEKSDIYSFGVVILELVTGRLPVDPEFGEKDLVKWVCTVLDQKGIDNVIDPKLDFCFKEEMCKALNIGLLCTSPLPTNRPSMRRVVKMLQELGSSRNPPRPAKKDGKMSPYSHQDA